MKFSFCITTCSNNAAGLTHAETLPWRFSVFCEKNKEKISNSRRRIQFLKRKRKVEGRGRGRGRERKRKGKKEEGKGEREIGSEALAETEKIANAPSEALAETEKIANAPSEALAETEKIANAPAFAIFSVSAKASLPISLSPFPSSFFPFLFLSLPLPLPSTFRLRFKISLFAVIPLLTILSGRARCTMATVTGYPSEVGLVCGHWIMPMLWSGGRTDKISNNLAGDIACLGGSMVEHQPRLLGSRVRFPAGAFAIFLFLPQLHFQFPFPLSLPLSFPSSSFPFLFLSLRPFVCALKSHSSQLSLY